MMMMDASLLPFLFFFFFSLHFIAENVEGGRIGFCYGRLDDSLPSPQKVVQILQKHSINLVRIYDHDTSVIQAFSGTGIELVIAIPNSELNNFQTAEAAANWVNSFLVPITATTKISGITVGAEVLLSEPELTPLLLPAMGYVHTALTKAGLSDTIMVTTTHSLAILQNSSPPSAASFNSTYATSFFKPLLDFHKATGSPLMVNVYPYLAYSSDPDNIPIDLALFQSGGVITDPNTNLVYHNLYDAQIDAAFFAMETLGYSGVNVAVGETGWPTKGGTEEAGASPQNAATFNNNLMKQVLNGSGSPHHPGQAMDVYIFALFNENLKPGAESEHNWGVFNDDGSNIYPLALTVSSQNQSTTNATTPSGSPPPPTQSSSAKWCVAVSSASNDSLKDGLDWACGTGNVDCGPIQQGQPCFSPDTLVNHASYAYNIYYHQSGGVARACNFSGTATITTTNPSYGSCTFLSSTSSTTRTNTSVTNISSISPSLASSTKQWSVLSLLTFILVLYHVFQGNGILCL